MKLGIEYKLKATHRNGSTTPTEVNAFFNSLTKVEDLTALRAISGDCRCICVEKYNQDETEGRDQIWSSHTQRVKVFELNKFGVDQRTQLTKSEFEKYYFYIESEKTKKVVATEEIEQKNNFSDYFAPAYHPDDITGTYNTWAETFWQLACDLAAAKINVDGTKGLADIKSNPNNPWNIATQLLYPVCIGCMAGYMQYKNNLDIAENDAHLRGEPLTESEISSLRKSGATLAFKIAASMGGWEAGYFAAQCFIQFVLIAHFPHVILSIVALCVFSGLLQAAVVVLSQIADEKRKYGAEYNEKKTPTSELGKLFVTTFLSGAAWQALSYFFSPLAIALAPIAKTSATY